MLFIVLGICMVGLAVFLNVSWIILNWRRLMPLLIGIPFFLLLIAGVVLNTIFLVREVRRNEQHNSFINAVTHELKTPITSIRLYLETLERRELSDEQRREFYGIMLNDSDRLLATVEQVLKAGELGQSSRSHIRVPVDMRAIVADAIYRIRTLHHLTEEDLSLEEPAGDQPVMVRGDQEDLRTVVMNLLNNAVKYSPEATRVTVALRNGGRTAAVSVADQGMGMEPKEMERLFTRFYRTPRAEASGISGTGLGLSIVQQIVNAHGGRIEVASEAGKGSCFTLTLPIERKLVT